ncbi:hypothetical protein J6590_045374 [Homalodisca vitripennis]|nr:hypothetical protein J6590_045374 [Homalodisca vitripennis]
MHLIHESCIDMLKTTLFACFIIVTRIPKDLLLFSTPLVNKTGAHNKQNSEHIGLTPAPCKGQRGMFFVRPGPPKVVGPDLFLSFKTLFPEDRKKYDKIESFHNKL